MIIINESQLEQKNHLRGSFLINAVHANAPVSFVRWRDSAKVRSNCEIAVLRYQGMVNLTRSFYKF